MPFGNRDMLNSFEVVLKLFCQNLKAIYLPGFKYDELPV